MKLKKTLWLVLLCMIWNICAETPIMTTMEAATQTSAQKAKEKAKAKKAKEKEKARKAREKEKAKKAKQKAKDEGQKAKGEGQKASYEEQVAEVEKWNAHVAEYMSRDISHSIDFWGQVGYSALFTKTNYTPASAGSNAQGYQENAKGWVGGGIGAGYQLRYRRFLLQTGAEFQLYGSRNVLYSDDAKHPALTRQYSTAYQAPDGMKSGVVDYTYSNMTDQLLAGYVQIPVMAGMQFYDNKLYFLVGPKVGMSVVGSSKLQTDAVCTITDPELISVLQNMDNHGLVSRTMESGRQKIDWGLNLAAAAEIGGYVHRQVRLALFAEYGLLNIHSASNICDEAGELPVALPKNGDPIDIGWNQPVYSSLQTTTARDARVNPFLVGAKATFLLELPRKVLKPMPMPKEPMPMMLARVVNAESEQPISGIGVQFINTETGAITSKTTNAKGLVNSKLPKGNYLVKASRQGYYPDSLNYVLSRDRQDTLLLHLRQIPAPIIYTYCAHVYARDTRAPVEAEIRICDSGNQNVLYTGTATEDGLFVTNLPAGRYVTHLRYPGYMPLDDTVQFVQDTLTYYMTKIKEGIRVKINNLFFATNKTYILPESESAMEDLALFLTDNPTVNIRITGHTDSIGSDAANQQLSEGRASSVRRELIRRGVDGTRIEAEGKGESEPVDTNSTEEGRQNNRRVEFTITSTGEKDIKQIK